MGVDRGHKPANQSPTSSLSVTRWAWGRTLQAPWLLMIETDYVWLKPLAAPPAEAPASRAQAFPFGYITPQVQAWPPVPHAALVPTP